MSRKPGERAAASEASKGVPTGEFQRFMSRAEVATVVGMVVVVFSLFFTWQSVPLDTSQLPPGSMILQRGGVSRVGFDLPPIRWSLVACAVLSCSMLLWTPTPRTRLWMNVVQVACGLACFMIALTRFAPLPGVIMGGVGGALLTFGAVDRFTSPPQKL